MIKNLIIVVLLILIGLPTSQAQAPQRIPMQVSSAVASSIVAKTQPGYLLGFVGTTGSTPGCFFFFNATSLPANGSVTPAIPPLQAAANSSVSLTFSPAPAPYFATGITIGFSSTCGLTLTASATALFGAMVQ